MLAPSASPDESHEGRGWSKEAIFALLSLLLPALTFICALVFRLVFSRRGIVLLPSLDGSLKKANVNSHSDCSYP